MLRRVLLVFNWDKSVYNSILPIATGRLMALSTLSNLLCVSKPIGCTLNLIGFNHGILCPSIGNLDGILVLISVCMYVRACVCASNLTLAINFWPRTMLYLFIYFKRVTYLSTVWPSERINDNLKHGMKRTILCEYIRTCMASLKCSFRQIKNCRLHCTCVLMCI